MSEMPLDFMAARAARLYSPKASTEDTEGAIFHAVQQASVDQIGEPLSVDFAEAIALSVIEALSEHFARLSRRVPGAEPSADPDDAPPHPGHVPLIRIIKRHGCTLPETTLGRLLAFVAAGGPTAVAEGHAHDEA